MISPADGGIIAKYAAELRAAIATEIAAAAKKRSRVPVVVAADAPPGKKRRTCSICRRPGHWATTCPRLPVCEECGGRGHTARRCPLELATRPGAPAAASEPAAVTP